MTDAFPHLRSPQTIGTCRIKNRIALLPMGLKFTNDGMMTESDIAFYEARAAGGVGLIITGGTMVSADSTLRGRRNQEAFRPESVPGFARLVDAVHRHDATIFGQIVHKGREPLASSDGPLIGPSPISARVGAAVPHELTSAEISEVSAAFVRSAMHLVEAGYDGVELHGAHGYLIGTFLSPAANHRDDEYGGSIANRVRFAVDIARRIKAEAGRDVPVGIRISADEQIDDGLDLTTSPDVAKALEDSGVFDYLSVAIGTHGGYVKDMSSPQAVAVSAAAAIRGAVGLPVIASQRITHPTTAERIIASGAADMVGMARALIADAEWVNHAFSGSLERILPCVGALQDCRAETGGIGCVHSATSGRERTTVALVRARSARRIVVVGGGPGGLEAARIAAERDHDVVVIEREKHPGGQVRLAAKAPARGEIGGMIDFRMEELARLGVEVRLEHEATVASVLAESPSKVILATGARPSVPDVPIDARADVRNLWSLFDGAPLTAGQTAVIVDDGTGGWETFSAAEFVAEQGLAVTILVPGPDIAKAITAESRSPLLGRLARRDVTILGFRTVSEVRSNSVLTYDPVRTRARQVLEEIELPADVVVFSGPNVPNDLLAAPLRVEVPTVSIGDAVSIRQISQAILEGYREGSTC